MSELAAGILVVLYRPTPQQLQTLQRHRLACERLIAIDNTPVADEDVHRQLSQAGIDWLHNANRGGIAGAFNRGIEWLSARGAQVFVLFDQDSEPEADYLAAMLEACRQAGPSFMIGPKIFDVNVRQYLPSFLFKGWRVSRVRLSEKLGGGLIPCSFLISSGLAVSAEASRRLGPFREDYFIDHVDTEYCFRAARLGVPMFVNPAVSLRHAIGHREEKRVLGVRIGAMNHSAARRYYLARNGLHLGFLTAARFPAALLLNLLTLSQVLAIVLVERDKRRKLLALFAGVLDGLGGRLGEFEQRWPHLAADCATESLS